MSQHLGRRVLAVVLVIGAAVAVVLTRPVRLGLDLRGGTQVVLEAQDTASRRADSDATDRALEVMRRRVDQLGVSEPTLQRSGQRRIIIELPGVADPDEALRVIGRTAQLIFHPVLGIAEEQPESSPPAPPSPTPSPTGSPGEEELVLPDETGTRLRLGPSRLTGETVRDAQAVFDSQELTGQWLVNVTFAGEGARRWEELTGEAACQPAGDPRRRIAIVLDRDVISSPQVAPEVECEVGIGGGTTSITGDFADQEAKDLALLIRAGALPVPVEVIEQRTIGPTLGEEAIRASVVAALIGAALTIAYMVVYYRLLGAAAALALLLYGLFSFAVLLGIGATLTLPGIAGFVLAIGMAVDANVLVFERIKEEHAAGHHLGSSVANGFTRAWSAIADSNATTLLAAILLFFLASGAVKGFGITLTIGVAVSLFSALVVTRIVVELLVRSPALRTRPRLLGMHVGMGIKRWIEGRAPNIIGHSKVWFVVSGAVLGVAVSGLAFRGLELGLEFKGGRLVEYATAQPVDLDILRTELAKRGFPRALVQESGEGNVSVRTGALSNAEEERVLEALAFVGGQTEELREEFIGATISDELLGKAVIALGLALTVQLAYLAFRFRWTYGTSAVAAMFHDVVILLGVFAWLGKTIDGVFLAALLTVIGYSVNDSVVVFDRIREQRALRGREPLAVVANDACLQTIPRTINTGLGALFILAALYFLGGETLTDFALALLVGILVGTYSSVFTAAPLAVAIDGRGSSRTLPTPRTIPARPRPSTPAPTRGRPSAPRQPAGSARRKGTKSRRKTRRR